MTDMAALPTSIDVPARSIPFPATLSAEAIAVLAFMSQLPPLSTPDPRDTAAWEAAVSPMDAPELAEVMGLATTGAVFDDTPTNDGETSLPTARIFTAVPRELLRDDLVFLYIHGGGFTNGGGDACRLSSRFVANTYGLETWNVDYRMPPANPYPAGLDDCMDAYRLLTKDVDPGRVVVGGLSAGANLSAALLLKLQDQGELMPAGLVLNSPPADAFVRGDTVVTNSFATASEEGGLANVWGLYAGDADLSDPYLSPIAGAFGADWPHTLLLTGTRDFLLSDTVRMHRKLVDAGVATELHVFEGAPHGFFGGRTPEDRMVAQQVRRFLLSL
jgi:epsilon-lactone hydrolase